MTKTTICIIGGHLSPAVAVIKAIQKTTDWEVWFVGRKYAMEGDKQVSTEFKVVKELGVDFDTLTTGRSQKGMSIETITSLAKVLFGFFQAVWLLLNHRPKLIISFGGYLAVPVVIAGWMLGIPSVTHEQTSRVGLANQIIARFSRRVYVSFGDTVSQFPQGKAKFVGLPLREGLFTPPDKPSFVVPAGKLIYITGGTTGAESLNDCLFPLLNELLTKYVVIHQTGFRSLDKAQKIKNQLAKDLADRYQLAAYFKEDDVAWILSQASVVVGRAGANTVMELAALGIPAVLIPLPWSSQGEQQAMAEWLQNHGSAVVVPQSEASPSRLLASINQVSSNSQMKAVATKLAATISRQSALDLVNDIKTSIL